MLPVCSTLSQGGRREVAEVFLMRRYGQSLSSCLVRTHVQMPPSGMMLDLPQGERGRSVRGQEQAVLHHIPIQNSGVCACCI